jgi:hypothetical protein
MGRPPIGFIAMSSTERSRRYRQKHGLYQPATKPATKPDDARIRELEAENARLKHTVARYATKQGLSQEEIEDWAEFLGITKNEEWFSNLWINVHADATEDLVENPADTAKNALVDLHGWKACVPLYECLGKEIQKARDKEQAEKAAKRAVGKRKLLEGP